MSLIPLQTLTNLLVTMKEQVSDSQTFAGMSIARIFKTLFCINCITFIFILYLL